jgi:hypothetical protein
MSQFTSVWLAEVFLSITFAIILQLTPFDPTKKKKKKKKKVVIQNPSDEVDKLSEKTESLAGVPNALLKGISLVTGRFQ